MKNVAAPLPEPESVSFASVRAAYDSGRVDLVCVLGPTASGKTRYAVELARAIGGEIISADSRQVYRGMDIGTGKDLAEYGDVPYHLIDIVPIGGKYNVARFAEDFGKAAADIRSRGAVPILCGGTGLYINAVTAGSYSFDGLSKPLSESRDYSRTFFIGTLVDRQTRNERIDRRLDARLAEGMEDEIRGLLQSGADPQTLIAYGLEYKYVTEYVLGIIGKEQMRQQLATAIHRFAKRQMTWFRGMERAGAVIHWVKL